MCKNEPAPAELARAQAWWTALGFHDIRRLWPLGSLDDIELHVLPLFESFEPVTLESRVVNENIFAALESNKSKPFPVVKPFHSTLASHTSLLS